MATTRLCIHVGIATFQTPPSLGIPFWFLQKGCQEAENQGGLSCFCYALQQKVARSIWLVLAIKELPAKKEIHSFLFNLGTAGIPGNPAGGENNLGFQM
jgi:hypothetical protein